MLPKIVFFDIEGTLTGPGGRGHSRRLGEQFDRLMDRDVIVGLLTGRDASYAKGVNRLFDLNGPIIAENGCALIPDLKSDETGEINFGGIDSDLKEQIRDTLGQSGILSGMYEDPQKRYMFTLYLNSFPNHDPKEIISMYHQIDSLLTRILGLEVSYSSAAVDINPTGVNKGSAVDRYCREQGYDLSSIAFVGDSLNDRTAFEIIGEAEGQLALVGDSAELRKLLQGFSNVYHSKQQASEGTVEFIDVLLRSC